MNINLNLNYTLTLPQCCLMYERIHRKGSRRNLKPQDVTT